MTKNLILAALLSTVAAVSFAQTPAATPATPAKPAMPMATPATPAAAPTPMTADSKPAVAKKHAKKKVRKATKVAAAK